MRLRGALLVRDEAANHSSMKRLLHILTMPDDNLAETVINSHRQLQDREVMVVDLTDGAPDYDALLEEIFAADSVQVW